MKYIIVLLLSVLLLGCDRLAPPVTVFDISKQVELYKMCMETLPKGPDSTVYNDWAEVVEECRDFAFWGSQYCVRNCLHSSLPYNPDLAVGR